MTRRSTIAAIARIAEALNLDREGNAYRGRCPVPAHVSKSGRSFWVSMSSTGGLSLRCYGGCSYWTIFGSLAQRGLVRPRPDHQPPEPHRSPLKPPLPPQTRHVARYGHRFVAP